MSAAQTIFPEALTRRERDVLEILAQGKTTKEIANALSISPKTVSVHRSHIVQKLRIHSAVELTRYAVFITTG